MALALASAYSDFKFLEQVGFLKTSLTAVIQHGPCFHHIASLFESHFYWYHNRVFQLGLTRGGGAGGTRERGVEDKPIFGQWGGGGGKPNPPLAPPTGRTVHTHTANLIGLQRSAIYSSTVTLLFFNSFKVVLKFILILLLYF